MQVHINTSLAAACLPDGDRWDLYLAQARTPAEVVDVARQFIDTWSPSELARLPSECRPPILHGPESVGTYALSMVRRRVMHDHDEQVARMADFFSTAQRHLAQLMSEAGQRSASNPRYWRSVTFRDSN